MLGGFNTQTQFLTNHECRPQKAKLNYYLPIKRQISLGFGEKIDIFPRFSRDFEISQSGWFGANSGAKSDQNNPPETRFSLTITAQPESLGSSPLLRTATLAKAAKAPRFDAETGSTKFSR